MRGKLSKPSKRQRKLAIDRPFAPEVLQRAHEIATQYRIALESDPDLGFVGNCIEMPLVMGDGRTPDACVTMTREAIVAVVAYMLESGQVPPAPAREQKRDQQLNLRLTLEEKLALEEAARQQGFRGVSDFVRTKSLAALRA